MTKDEILAFIRQEWQRLQAWSGEDLPVDAYERERFLRQIDEDTPEERGLVALIEQCVQKAIAEVTVSDYTFPTKIVLEDADFAAFSAALENPPAPTPQLVELFKKYKERKDT